MMFLVSAEARCVAPSMEEDADDEDADCDEWAEEGVLAAAGCPVVGVASEEEGRQGEEEVERDGANG